MSILSNELSTDPLARGYAAMTDDEVKTDLNLENITVQFSTVSNVRQYLITQISGLGVNKRSVIDMIREYFEAGTVRGVPVGVAPEARRSAAGMIWFMLGLSDSAAGFPVDDSNVAANFKALGNDGGNGPDILSNDQLLEIADLGKRSVSRAQQLGISNLPVSTQMVSDARGA